MPTVPQLVRDTFERECPLCGDNNWSEPVDSQSLYLPRAVIKPSGFGIHVLTFICDTCGYVLLIKRPEGT